MPELPEVQTVVSELHRKLKGKTIARVEVRASKIVSLGPQTVSNVRSVPAGTVPRFVAALRGQKITSVTRRAKMLVFDFVGPWCLLVHLKMTGQFLYEDRKLLKQTKGYYRILNKLSAPKLLHPTPHTHVIFYFTDDSRLYYNDVRKFGYLKLIRDSELGQVKELQAFGPEPLSKQFTYDVFYQQIQKYPSRKIKQALMDPSVIAGIGNIYSDEILFHAKVLPTRQVKSLSAAELKAIHKYIPVVLQLGVKYKGSSVGDFVRTDGSWGSMGKHHFVYGRSKQPCKKCGTTIKAMTLGGRTASFCPACQK